jgi:lipopolysaccharide transport system permease protein
MPNQAENKPVTVIGPSKGWIPIDFKEIWKYRELLYFLTKREIQVRYKQTVLGGLWAIIQPLFTMAVFTLFSGGCQDAVRWNSLSIFVYAGLLPWTYFANTLSNPAIAGVGSANLISKVYFPRLLSPVLLPWPAYSIFYCMISCWP